MNLSLYQLKKKLKSNKQAQGSLIAIVLGGVVLSTIVASGTSWYLTMRNNLGDTEDKLEAQTIAMSEWERLSHMSLDELEANRNALKNPYSAGTDSQFSVSVNLGHKKGLLIMVLVVLFLAVMLTVSKILPLLYTVTETECSQPELYH